jgi:hypothetical protein
MIDIMMEHKAEIVAVLSALGVGGILGFLRAVRKRATEPVVRWLARIIFGKVKNDESILATVLFVLRAIVDEAGRTGHGKRINEQVVEITEEQYEAGKKFGVDNLAPSRRVK